jgi:hypothetical protein
MSQQSANQKQKKKGKVPAHQNTFAFIHNVKSKMTDKITASANTHVCRRCHDKIEWRKQYRKYKPRTGAPGKCNLCQMKRIKCAYHTICEPCTRTSTKAVALLAELNQVKQKQMAEIERKEREEDDAVDKVELAELNVNDDKEEAPEDVDQADDEEDDDDDHVAPVQNHYRRICGICVKEPALRDGDEVYDDAADPFSTNGGKRLSLRERKTIERRLEKESKPKKEKKNEEDDENSNDEHAEDSDPSDSDEEIDQVINDDHAEDPFLQAIGGADKLLVGDAYQAMLLQKAAAAAEAESAK